MSTSEWISRIASLAVAVGCYAYALHDPRIAGFHREPYRVLLGMLVPVALIWFPEWFGSWARRRDGHEVPPLVFAVLGWGWIVINIFAAISYGQIE